MALLTQYASFYVSPFGERSVTDELNTFLRSHRIVNVEKRLIDGERGTGWLFLVEYGGVEGSKSSSGGSQRVERAASRFCAYPARTGNISSKYKVFVFYPTSETRRVLPPSGIAINGPSAFPFAFSPQANAKGKAGTGLRTEVPCLAKISRSADETLARRVSRKKHYK